MIGRICIQNDMIDRTQIQNNIKRDPDPNFFLNNIIALAGVFESKLMELTDPEARKAYLDETKCTSVLDKIIVQVREVKI